MAINIPRIIPGLTGSEGIDNGTTGAEKLNQFFEEVESLANEIAQNKMDEDGLNSEIDALWFNPNTLSELSNVGELKYSAASNTLEFKNQYAVFQLGQVKKIIVKNDQGSQVSSGKIMYISSSVSNTPFAKLASTSLKDSAYKSIGMTTNSVETKAQQKTLAYLDSAFQAKTEEFNAIKDKFKLEKDAEYQQVGNYLWPTQTIEKNMHRSYIRFQVNEQGIMSMTSIYCGAGNIHHTKVKVIAPDGSFAETPSSKDSYETTDMNEKIEKADYKLGEDGNVIEFLNLNKDKNIRVEYIGDRTYKTTMSPTDRQAAAGVYELAQILSAMEQIKKEQEEANLKIGFINKKKERKAQEEITD
jgi:hypothetical protein